MRLCAILLVPSGRWGIYPGSQLDDSYNGKNAILTDQTQPAFREWNSSAYHRLSGPQLSWGKGVLSRLRLRGDEVVLDAGCGTGRLTADLLAALPAGRVIAIDLSKNMLTAAREHLARYGERVQLLACDLLHLPFENAFDGIVSTAAFHWVLDHNRLFGGLLHALAPGGWLEAQCGGGPNLRRLRDRVCRLAAMPQFSQFFAQFREPWCFEDAQGAAENLRRAGFIEIETSIKPALTVLSNATEYREFVQNIILQRHLECLPTEGKCAQFIDNLTAQAEGDDPPFSLDYWRLNIRARKNS